MIGVTHIVSTSLNPEEVQKQISKHFKHKNNYSRLYPERTIWDEVADVIKQKEKKKMQETIKSYSVEELINEMNRRKKEMDYRMNKLGSNFDIKTPNQIREEYGLLAIKNPHNLTEAQMKTLNKNEKVNEAERNLDRFYGVTVEMAEIYYKKNMDYGNSFDESLDEDGLVVAKIRLGDKWKRFGQLIDNPANVTSESKRDTLLDMANYAIMAVMWMDKQGLEPKTKREDWED